MTAPAVVEAPILPSERIVALSTQPIARKHLYFGRALSPTEALTRLMHLRERALDAEAGGAFVTADFFWRRAHEGLTRAYGMPEVWREAARVGSDGGVPEDEGATRGLVIATLFADTHWAHYLGASAGDTPVHLERRLRHLDDLWLLHQLSPLDDARLGTLTAATRQEVHGLGAQDQWTRARILAEQLVRHAPAEEHQSLLIVATYNEGLKTLGGGDDASAQRTDAGRLESAVKKLEALRRRWPRNAFAYDILGRLCLTWAVKLANGRALSDALMAVARARLYDPALADAANAAQTLARMMTELQEAARNLQSEVASTPNARLNAEGQRMVKDADQGFTPMNQFLESAEAGGIREGFRLAQGASIARAAGLDLTALDDGQLTAMYGAFNSVMTAVSQQRPVDALAACRAEEALAGLDLRPLVSFLERRAVGQDVAPETSATPPAEWPTPVAAIAVPGVARRGDHEPVLYWLFSREARLVKFAALAAAVLLVVVLGFVVRDSRNLAARERAFGELRQARLAGDHLRAIQAAETFLSRRIFASDPREPEVTDGYSEALVKWAASSAAAPEDQQLRLTRYRELVLNRAR